MKTFLPGKYLYRHRFNLAGIFFILLVWHLAALAMDSLLILPSPVDILESGAKNIADPAFGVHLATTILRGLTGFVIAFILSLLTGVPAGLNEAFRQFIYPLLVTLRTLPVISFILLALIWFNPPQVPVFIAILTMFPVLTISIIDGLRNTDKNYLEMGSIYRVPRHVLIRDIYLPGSMPVIFNGISNAMAFGWRAIIIGEVLSQPMLGIGAQMQRSQIYLLVAEVIFWSVIAVLISAIFEYTVRRIEKQSIKWK